MYSSTALVILLFLPALATSSSFDGGRIELRRVFHDGGHANRLSGGDGLGLALSHYEYRYVLDVEIGTPPQRISAVVSTGGDLIWTQCRTSTKCFPQPTPYYDPARSCSYAPLPCNSALCQVLPRDDVTGDASCCSYDYSYVTYSTQGTLGRETFTMGSPDAPVSVPGIVFGCRTSSSSEIGFSNSTAGFIGLGRGPLSLVSQLQVDRFSYCLNPDTDGGSSALFLGSETSLGGVGAAVKSVNFLPPLNGSPFYHVSLKGISLGTTRLPINPDVYARKPDGTGGVILDCGVAITNLVPEAYTELTKALTSAVKLPLLEDSPSPFLCFSGSTLPDLPSLTFHFDGADLELTVEKYLGVKGGIVCLAMQESSGAAADTTIIGNYQQHDLHVLYDLQGEKLSFVPAQCGSLSSELIAS